MDFQSIGTYEKFKCKEKETGITYRAMRETGGTTFVFGPRSTRYGRRYQDNAFVGAFSLVLPKKGEDSEWTKTVKKVVRLLTESGLSPEVRREFEIALAIGEDGMKEINRACQTIGQAKDAWTGLQHKYPTAFDEYGNCIFRYLDYVFKPKLKSMYFGWRNAEIKGELEEALKRKRHYCVPHVRTSYDVSVFYEPNKNRCHYAEEYKNTGNGHYYLALNHSTALFVEDD